MNSKIVILPADIRDRIQGSGKNSGTLDMIPDRSEGVLLVSGYFADSGIGVTGGSKVAETHFLGHGDVVPRSAFWYRVETALHIDAYEVGAREAAVSIDHFRSMTRGQWKLPPDHDLPILTWTEIPDVGLHWLAWEFVAEQQVVIPTSLEIADPDASRLALLGEQWRLDILREQSLVLVGAGSIGGAAALSLATYGVGSIALVDPGRLRSHNFARHVTDQSQLGRFKVNALRDQLLQLDRDIAVEALSLDIVYDADEVRSVVDRADLVMVTSDGVASRRVANYLAREAGKDAVFACVLEDGAIGEVLRLRAPQDGCLECQRADLIRRGIMDPELGIDLDYGMWTRHRPMTAVGGDLHLVGQLAAKAAVATILESAGFREQALPSGLAIVGLQPKPGMAPPFDLASAGAVRWLEVPKPDPACPVCGQ